MRRRPGLHARAAKATSRARRSSLLRRCSVRGCRERARRCRSRRPQRSALADAAHGRDRTTCCNGRPGADRRLRRGAGRRRVHVRTFRGKRRNAAARARAADPVRRPRTRWQASTPHAVRVRPRWPQGAPSPARRSWASRSSTLCARPFSRVARRARQPATLGALAWDGVRGSWRPRCVLGLRFGIARRALRARGVAQTPAHELRRAQARTQAVRRATCTCAAAAAPRTARSCAARSRA